MELLRAHISQTLLAALSRAGVSAGSKAVLVVDGALSGALSLGVEAAALRSAGVERVVALAELRSVQHSATLRVVVVLRPTLKEAKAVVDWLVVAASLGHPVHVLFVPRRSLVCERVFEDAGVSASVVLSALPIDILPLDDDLLSLELDNAAFRQLYLEKDPSCLHSVAKALLKLQALHGIIPKILGKGTNAHTLANLMLRMRREVDASSSSPESSSSLSSPSSSNSPFNVFPPKMDFDSIIILDRTVDLVTPLCMQLTYEGLVDEVFGIKTTFVQVNESFIATPANQQQQQATATASTNTPNSPIKTKKVSLNPVIDKLYTQLRDLNFAMVGAVLNQNARRIQDEVDTRHDAKTISQIKDFIGKLGGLEGDKAFLKLHTSIAEEITKRTQDPDFNKFLELQQNVLSGNQIPSQLDYLEEMVDKQAPLLQTLRLISLYSVVCGGIKAKQLELLKREIIQTYGIHHLTTLQNLHSLSLLTSLPQTSAFDTPLTVGTGPTIAPLKPSFANLRKPLAVIVDDIDEQNPTDIAYVYSGYAPASVRLVEAATGVGKFLGVGTAPIKPAVRMGSVSLDQLSLNANTNNPTRSGTASPARGARKERKVSWEGVEELARVVPGGAAFEMEQGLTDPNFVARSSVDKERKTTLVLFLGGCTSTEVSSLRFLSKGKGGRQFVVLTTGMLTGSRMIDSLVEKVDNVTGEL